jgi:ferredoxin
MRKIIKIDDEKCNGCGLCVNACHEGAIGLVNGKAKLLRDDYCDGLGDCLPACPTGAISFEEREAKEYNEEAVKEHKIMKILGESSCSSCGTEAKTITHNSKADSSCECVGTKAKNIPYTGKSEKILYNGDIESKLKQWPVQIKLVPVNAPYFNNANLLIAADCTAYAYGNFHNDFIKNHITLIGCSKLDEGDYAQKLTEIIKNNNIKSVKIVRMDVPCCGGMERAVITALQNSGKFIPWQVVVISSSGEILE